MIRLMRRTILLVVLGGCTMPVYAGMPSLNLSDIARARWRVRWTALSVVIVLLMFTAGIAATGITHQAAWLARSDQPMFTLQGRSRESANRVKCGSNMRQIGQAIQIYAADNGGKLPDSLELLLTLDITGEAFICPSSNDEKAPGATAEERARNLHKHCSYVYHGRGLTTDSPKDTPILCEPLMHHQHAGMNVLFADGHVDFLSPTQAKAVMDRVK
jgi:prepilin-type processing-associated H-X9-DG protein